MFNPAKWNEVPHMIEDIEDISTYHHAAIEALISVCDHCGRRIRSNRAALICDRCVDQFVANGFDD
jgi:ABC-type ATPase with predicted acetyltransferase domain